MTEEELIALLNEASLAEYGVVVETNDPNFLRQKLYPLRQADPYFHPLAFVISPMGNGDLWIIRNQSNEE